MVIKCQATTHVTKKKRERGRKNFEAWTLQENLKAGDP
jgi:hypothetical protein